MTHKPFRTALKELIVRTEKTGDPGLASYCRTLTDADLHTTSCITISESLAGSKNHLYLATRVKQALCSVYLNKIATKKSDLIYIREHIFPEFVKSVEQLDRNKNNFEDLPIGMQIVYFKVRATIDNCYFESINYSERMRILKTCHLWRSRRENRVHPTLFDDVVSEFQIGMSNRIDDPLYL